MTVYSKCKMIFIKLYKMSCILFFFLVAINHVADFFNLDVEPSDTVAVVKARIQDKKGEQRVFF